MPCTRPFVRLATALVALALITSVRAAEKPASCCVATVEAQVPDGTGTLYLTGNLESLGPWKADALAMSGDGSLRCATVTVPSGTLFEYKFTLGSWDREAVGPSGMVMGNFRLQVDANTSAQHEIGDFKKDAATYIADWKGSGVLGTLVYWTDVSSTYLQPARHVEIWLPPGYSENPTRRYRVLYMSDGQNLFDPRIANTGVDWGVDEAVVGLVEKGEIEPIIVVGVWSTDERGAEYSPWHRAPEYAKFLINELMPRINREFRTLTGPENTAHMGSSMGGLLSFYLAIHHPEAFAACGCVSTHFPLSEAVVANAFANVAISANPDETPYVIRDIKNGMTVPKGARLWFDYGTETLDASYGPTHAAVKEWLLTQGQVEGRDFVIRRYAGSAHNEAAWRARLKDSLRFLYSNSR